MAFPDWPTSNGHLVNPPQWWQQNDTRWEHGHRLIGWVVGMLAIGTTALSFKRGKPVKQLAIATLIAIIIQGVLGGLRVREISTSLALVHGIWGQLCFCLACTTALLCSRGWMCYDGGPHKIRGASTLQRLCLASVFAVFIQLLSGATYRHMAISSAILIHVLWVVILSLVVGCVVMWIITQNHGQTLLGKLGRALATLMVIQLFLGGFSFLIIVLKMSSSAFAIWAIPSAHVAVGALMFACSLSLCLCSFRILRPAPEEVTIDTTGQATATS